MATRSIQGILIPFTRREDGYLTLRPIRDVIKSSIRMILGTTYGERLYIPDFGSRIRQLLFEPNDFVLEGQLKVEVEDALTKWEPRITLEETLVQFPTDEHRILLTLRYLINAELIQDEAILVLPRPF